MTGLSGSLKNSIISAPRGIIYKGAISILKKPYLDHLNRFFFMNVDVLYALDKQTKSVCPSVWYLSVCMYVRTWVPSVDTITFKGFSGSKQNLVCVFYVWNVVLALKSKEKSCSCSWSWTGLWFWQKICGTTPNSVDIFNI